MDRFNAGEKFQALSKIYGRDAARPDGGDWGWQQPADIKREFSDQIFGAKTGEIIGPVVRPGPDGCFLFFIEARE